MNEERAKALKKKQKKDESRGKALYYTTEIKPKKSPLKPTFSIEKSREISPIDRQTSFKFEMNEVVLPEESIPEKAE